MTQVQTQPQAKPLTPQELALGRNYAESIRASLTHLGMYYKTQDGSIVEISFRGHGFTPDRRYWAGEIDMNSLPPRVSVKKLCHPETLHHLTASIGMEVKRLNTVGLTYCIPQEPPQPLPSLAHIDWKSRPAPHDAHRRPLYNFAVGLGHNGPQYLSLLDTNHLLIGGATRMGKTTFLNTLLCSLLPYYSPEELVVAFVDPKGVEFNTWNGVPHQIAPIAEEAHEALALFKALVREMERRRQVFKTVNARNLVQCNERLVAEGKEPLPMILVIIDELTDLALVDDRIYTPLTRLASKGAAFGFTLVLSTQNPKFEYVPTGIRGNLSTRIAFYVSSPEHSRVILGQNINGRGAHQLPRIKGRFLLRYDLNLIELQGLYVSDALTERIADHLRTSKQARAQTLDIETEDPSAATAGDDWDVRTPVDLGRAHQPTGDLPPLTEIEWEMLRVAVDDFDGELAVGRLYDSVRERGISKNAISRLVTRLLDAGWIEESTASNGPRRCTISLVEAVAAHFADMDTDTDTETPQMQF